MSTNIGCLRHAYRPYILRGSIIDQEKTYMVCTDSIYKKADKRKVADILNETDVLEEKARAILFLAEQNGSDDDKSVVLIHYSSCQD